MATRFNTLSANFHLTHNCNLRCTYCYTGEKFGSGMTPETRGPGHRFLPRGGRPLPGGSFGTDFLRWRTPAQVGFTLHIVDRAVERANGLRVSSKMSTNGVRLTEHAIVELSRRGVYVSISLDGDPATQAEQRPDVLGRDMTQQLDQAIDRLLEWNPCATVNCVVTPRSAAKLDESVAWLFGRGFAYIQTALDYSDQWTRDDLKTLQAAYERLADWYVAETLANKKFYLSCFDTRIQSRTRGPVETEERCFIGQRQFSIAPSGRLYPCVQFVQEDQDSTFVIGDVFRGMDPAKQQSISCCAEAEKPECGGCALLTRCSSWCACVNWQSTGSLDRASPVVCEHERLLMPIADRVGNRLWKKRDPNFLHKHYNPAFPVLSFVEQIVIKELDHAEAD